MVQKVGPVSKFHPELSDRLHKLVLTNSRSPRPGEFDGKDYHFRKRTEIEVLTADSRYVVMEVRGDLQALDVRELQNVLQEWGCVLRGKSFYGACPRDTPKPSARQSIEHLSVASFE